MEAPPFAFSAKAYRTGEQPISHLMCEAVTRPDLISLAAGLVDYESLPTKALRPAVEALLSNPDAGSVALQYGTTAGLAPLREAWLAHQLRMDGLCPEDLNLTPDHVVLTTGSQQGLYLVTDVLVDPGDVVITSAPSYFVYTHALASFGADVRTVPMDEDGMRVDHLEVLLEELADTGKLARLKLIYVVSAFQNPTGITLSGPRRQRLVELARTYSRSHRIVILEDAAYRELRYEGQDVASVKSYDTENRFVVLAATFSKPFSPGIKTGSVVLPDGLVSPVLWQKGNHDFGSQNLGQHLLLESLQSGAYTHHVHELREVYTKKRDVMLNALDTHLSSLPGIKWIRPEGGLYVWLTLPDDWDAGPSGELYRRSLDKGVMYVPGSYCYAGRDGYDAPANEIRLSFGAAKPEAIAEGVRRFGEAVRELAAHRSNTVGNQRSVTTS